MVDKSFGLLSRCNFNFCFETKFFNYNDFVQSNDYNQRFRWGKLEKKGGQIRNYRFLSIKKRNVKKLELIYK